MKSGNLKIALSLLVTFLLLFSTANAKKVNKEHDEIKSKKAKTENKITQLSSDQQSTIATTPQTTKYDLPTKATSGETINWQVFSSGGSFGTSSNYQLQSVIGQTAVGTGTSTNYTLISGFLQNFSTTSSPTCCIGVRGNIDGDILEIVDISDLVYMVDYQFRGGDAPACVYEADLAEISEPPIVDISDLVFMVDYQFRNGDAPTACP